MANLNELVRSLPPLERRQVEIDLSAFFPDAAKTGPVIFVYRDLQTKELFDLPALMRYIQKQRPEWSEELTGTVALLVSCHVVPAPEGEGLQNQTFFLYCELIDRLDKEELIYLITEFHTKFPHLENFQKAVGERKKK